MEQSQTKRKKIAWGITGAGDKIKEYIEVMERVKKTYADKLDIHVFVSKAGETVLKFYQLEDRLKESFEKVKVETNSNSPFLAAWLQMGKYEFLLIAPATSNTVAKIASGIGDAMLTNSAIMGLKAFKSIYIAPTDYEEGICFTKLPNGKEMRLRVRKEEVEKVNQLRAVDGIQVVEGPGNIEEIFRTQLGK